MNWTLTVIVGGVCIFVGGAYERWLSRRQQRVNEKAGVYRAADGTRRPLISAYPVEPVQSVKMGRREMRASVTDPRPLERGDTVVPIGACSLMGDHDPWLVVHVTGDHQAVMVRDDEIRILPTPALIRVRPL